MLLWIHHNNKWKSFGSILWTCNTQLKMIEPHPKSSKVTPQKNKHMVHTPKDPSFNGQHDYVYTDTTVGFTPGLCIFLYVYIYRCIHTHTHPPFISTCLPSHLSYPGSYILPSINSTDLRYPLLFIESYFDTGTAASIPCIIHISRNMSSLTSFKSQALKHCMIAIVNVHNPLWGIFFLFWRWLYFWRMPSL